MPACFLYTVVFTLNGGTKNDFDSHKQSSIKGKMRGECHLKAHIDKNAHTHTHTYRTT